MAASVADQGVAALTNILVVVFVARQSTAAGFASFAVVYTVFAVLLGASTAYVGQALVLRRGPAPEVSRHCRSSAVFTLTASTCLGAVLAAGGLLIPGELATGLGALGLVLPLVLTQDALRYAFSVLGLPHHALAADALRLAAVVPVLAAQPYGTGPARMVLLWGLSALPALLLGTLLLLRATRGAGPLAVRSLVRRDHLGRRFVVEFGFGNAGTQLAIIGLGLFASPLAVGALRGATTLFGPMNVLFNAVTGFGPPLLNRLTDARRKARAAALAGTVLAAVAAVWATVLALLPATAGRQLLGETWDSAAALLPATGSQYAAMALGTCGLLTLRVLRPRTTLSLQIAFSLFSVACLLGGYALGGVLGAAWGLCLGSATKAAATWLRTRAILREPDGIDDRAR
ncbi:hypothetical protein PJ985_09585 [Streptomyces sp. ACA25]|uniref:hypothetical protein n=1 Tax=Streptomyces sp. ACA25 TaxID=3022596 RepID=UPI0023075E1B|nr:hypothetical protein [Streptomyces sp. ACA25]MDB1087814.1 hypothetical protein [Streptomyces sp. ACA25]